MRVLVVSHTVFSSTNNMGKTMLGWFSGFQKEEVAQFYIQPVLPEPDCLFSEFYRFTDGDALKSLLGKEIRKETGEKPQTYPLKKLYQMGARRNILCYILRNFLWKVSRWETEDLKNWAAEFSPDVIFLAAGDYGFFYEIGWKMAQWTGKPLVIACVDDFYCSPKRPGLLGRWEHWQFMKSVHRAMEHASMLCVISNPMKEEYEKRFQKPCKVLHTPAKRQGYLQSQNGSQLSYLGNLSLGRGEQLIQMGCVLQRHRGSGLPEWIDVYSGEQDSRVIRKLKREKGIHFHGAVSAGEVGRVFANSMAVIHVESFGTRLRSRIRFSVSTKIPESLHNGPCLIAYGPEDAASIAYLQETNSAYVITDPNALEDRLLEILKNQPLRQSICERARAVAAQNHDWKTNSAALRSWLTEVCQPAEGIGI